MLYVLIAVLVFFDQFIKNLITQNIVFGGEVPVIDGFFSIVHATNTGGAFSFLAENNWGIFLLSGISVVVSVILLYILFRLRSRQVFWIRFAIALLVSGTIGNMIDRIRVKSVVDYLMFTFGTYTFPIFNLADMCIVCGSILLAVLLMFDKKLFRTEEDKMKTSIPTDSDTTEGKSPANDA